MNSDLLFDLIETIGAVSSRHRKQNLLIPELKRVLHYAYDPFKNYGVRQHTPIKYQGTKQFTDGTFSILDNLAARKVSGKKAKELVDMYRSTLTFKSRELFERILKKDLRCGVSTKLINEVFPYLVADGITMQPKEYRDYLCQLPLYCSLKLRGVRGYYRHEDNMLYSRKGKPFYGLEHITNQLQPHGRDFDGELLVPYIPFEEGAGLIRNKEKTPQVWYCVFDSPDDSRRFESRYTLYALMLKGHDKIIPVKHTLIIDSIGLETMFQDALDSGYEGIVCKNRHSFYKPGYSFEWLKMKEVADPLDLEIIGWFEGKGKYEMSLGGFIVDYKGKPVKVGGGFTDAQRIRYWSNPKKYVGRTIEVKYQEITRHGSLRNPIFLRLRESK